VTSPALIRSRFQMFAVLTVSLCASAWPQTETPAPIERTYPRSPESVQRALEQIGGFSGGKLPMIDGFVPATVDQIEHYERPYYQYRIQVSPVDAHTTLVRVEAKITAWYVDPQPSGSQYRSLVSNGRLEADLLDRLQDVLGVKLSQPGKAPASGPVSASSRPLHGSSDPPGTNTRTPAVKGAGGPAAPQQQLDSILAERREVRDKTSALRAQIEELKTASRKPANAARLASVKHSGVGVMSRKNFGGPVLFRAQAEDEFEVVSIDTGWATVILGPNSTGYLQADELNLPATLAETPQPSEAAHATEQLASTKPPDLGFLVSREDVSVFSGDWVRLKGKKVLFVYAQPRGLLSDLASDDAKLVYAKRIFQSRYRTVAQSGPGVEGVVVVFLGSKGGVAAATLADIEQWVEGALGDEAFVNRCSLDPRAEFRSMRLN
jgi:hypothetical protein